MLFKRQAFIKKNDKVVLRGGLRHIVLLLLNIRGGCTDLSTLRLKTTSWAFLLRSGLKIIFHL